MAMAAGVGPARTLEEPAGEADKGALPLPRSSSDRRTNAGSRCSGCAANLTVELPLPDFKIADLLKLRRGSVVDAHWRVGQDVPLRLNATLIGWIEFEVVAGNLAVRLTELA